MSELVSALQWNFNPRPREEGDRINFIKMMSLKNFNPRPREEGDERYSYPQLSQVNFNPRPREEGDYKGGI